MGLKDLNIGAGANEPRVLALQHPSEQTDLLAADKAKITITLLGKDSDVFSKARRITKKKVVDAARKNAPYSPAMEEQCDIEDVARATTAWSGIPKCWFDGGEDETPVTFTYEKAVELYTKQKWVWEQADKFVGERGNFLKASSTN